MKLELTVPERLAKQLNEEIKNAENVRVESMAPSSTQGASSFEPSVTIVLILAGYGLVSRLLDLLTDKLHPGIVVHLDANGDLTVEQGPGLATRHVLFISPDGQREMFSPEDIGKGLLEAAMSRFVPSTG